MAPIIRKATPMTLPMLLVPLFLLLTVPSGARASQLPDQRVRKKLLSLGWDHPTPAQLCRDLAEMDRRPLDGVAIGVTARGAPASLGTNPFVQAFSDRKWKREWFEESIRDLKALRPKRLQENFLWLFANPGNVDWFDDNGWKNIVEHCRMAAWIARQGGLRGVWFDPEPYQPPFAPFRYGAQPQDARRSFDEYAAKVRQRGREVMRAMAAEYPGMTVFTTFMNSWNLPAARNPYPRRLLASEPYGLLPAFFDGWMDVLPKSITLVDGGESAYLYNDELSFYRMAVETKVDGQKLVSPENRAKYRSQVQVSFGIYLDAYVNPASSPFRIDGKGRPQIERLQENLGAALRCADEYVWLYGEKGRWWPEPKETAAAPREVYPPWNQVFHGVEQVAAYARDRKEALQDQLAELRRTRRLTDLARNGDFSTAPPAAAKASTGWSGSGAPPQWDFWQAEYSKGRFGWDPAAGAARKGSVRMENVAYGSFIQDHPVKPGERYAVLARGRSAGSAAPFVRVRWVDHQGHWLDEGKDVLIPSPPPVAGSATDWQEMAEMVTVPEGAGKLVLLLGVTGRTSPGEIAWFDDVHLYALP
jgi:hypothetical protein